MPGVQKPHCAAKPSAKARCSGCRSPPSASPSSVVDRAALGALRGNEAGELRLAVDQTVQAPQVPCLQPILVRGEAELVAQHVDEERAGLDELRLLGAVDGELERNARHRVLPQRFSRRARCTGSTFRRYQSLANGSDAGGVPSPATATACGDGGSVERLAFQRLLDRRRPDRRSAPSRHRRRARPSRVHRRAAAPRRSRGPRRRADACA